jgi:hypothetical protein
LALDVSAAGALARRLALQVRVREASHATFVANKSAEMLRTEIRNFLVRASDKGLIAEGSNAIRQLVVMSPAPRDIQDATHSIATPGPRNFHRDPALPHFTRLADGATFDFQIGVQEKGRELLLLAYGFELRLPEGSPLPFLRYDLSPVVHRNTENGLRSHMHLGSDDDGFSVPAPMLSPFEVFDLFLHLVCPDERRRSAG